MTEENSLIQRCMDATLAQGASDLHLCINIPPTIRVSGTLTPLLTEAPLTSEVIFDVLKELLPVDKLERFRTTFEADFSYSFKGGARFRCNAYIERGAPAIAMRLIPHEIRSVNELNLPAALERFAGIRQGFFLVVGPVGQGKTTTLAALIEKINLERAEVIVTIEDPIEYLFENKRSLINQREVRTDTHSFEAALESVLREDINVLMIGEMRSPETMAAAVTAAETGHLVFSTLHTNNAVQTIDRIIDSFPAEQQNQIRLQLASSLIGVFSQRLVPRISGGQIPACELLISNHAVANLIREKRTHEIQTVIETGSEDGMIDMNRSLAELVRRGEVTVEDAYERSWDTKALQRLL